MTTKHTPGPWILATSNSWRRFESARGGMVCEPIKQNDGHPDLYFKNGGEDGPDAKLIAAAPDLLAALQDFVDDISDRFDLESSSTNPGIKYCVMRGREVIAKATT